MTNGQWCIKEGMQFSDLLASYSSEKDKWIITDESVFSRRVGDVSANIASSSQRAVLKWLDMEKSPVLNESEKQYLKAVINPWRNQVDYICKMFYKYEGNIKWDFLMISYTNDCRSWSLAFPAFNETHMYRGMEESKNYTPEELGL